MNVIIYLQERKWRISNGVFILHTRISSLFFAFVHRKDVDVLSLEDRSKQQAFMFAECCECSILLPTSLYTACSKSIMYEKHFADVRASCVCLHERKCLTVLSSFH
jgi:hypothetical protein